jgi:hypothetical protein
MELLWVGCAHITGINRRTFGSMYLGLHAVMPLYAPLLGLLARALAHSDRSHVGRTLVPSPAASGRETGPVAGWRKCTVCPPPGERTLTGAWSVRMPPPFGAATGLRGVPGPPDDGVSTAWTGAARARTWSLAKRSKRSHPGEAGV